LGRTSTTKEISLFNSSKPFWGLCVSMLLTPPNAYRTILQTITSAHQSQSVGTGVAGTHLPHPDHKEHRSDSITFHTSDALAPLGRRQLHRAKIGLQRPRDDNLSFPQPFHGRLGMTWPLLISPQLLKPPYETRLVKLPQAQQSSSLVSHTPVCWSCHLTWVPSQTFLHRQPREPFKARRAVLFD
jgi:hypothetical protein